MFATGKQYQGKEAIIDSFINRSCSEEEWLKRNDVQKGGGTTTDDWSPARFIQCRNLIKHYPVFACDKDGKIQLQPLNPLPDNISISDWGSYIGFDKNPSEYFQMNDYNQYYSMEIVGSTGKPSSEHLGPHFSELENPDVDESALLPLWTRLDFDLVPIELQSLPVLRSYLLNRGVQTNEDDAADMIRKCVNRANETEKQMLDPCLMVEPA